MIGPAGEENLGAVAVTRTPTRLFVLPASGGLGLLLGRGVFGGAGGQWNGAGQAPVFGVHPPVAYPPLSVPPGPPPANSDETDGRFERKLRWLLILVLLFAALFTGGNVLLPPLAWAEMPTDQALVRVERGNATAVVNGTEVDLGAGDEIYVGESDEVTVGPRSRALMTYRGGSTSVLCAGTELEVDALSSGGEPVAPTARLSLRSGLALVDTASTSPAFADLDLGLLTTSGIVASQGPAWFAVSGAGVQVSAGQVTFAGSPVPEVGGALGCGDGGPVDRPSGTPTPTPSSTGTPTPTPTPDPTLTPTPSATATAPGQTSSSSSSSSTSSSTSRPPRTTTRRPPRTTTRPPPPPNQPPTITSLSLFPDIIASDHCDLGTKVVAVIATATDDRTPVAQLDLAFTYNLQGKVFGPFRMTWTGRDFQGEFNPDIVIRQGSVTAEVIVTATDQAGAQRTRPTKLLISSECPIG
jgi:putative peptide zinc metalloprotease protein